MTRNNARGAIYMLLYRYESAFWGIFEIAATFVDAPRACSPPRLMARDLTRRLFGVSNLCRNSFLMCLFIVCCAINKTLISLFPYTGVKFLNWNHKTKPNWILSNFLPKKFILLSQSNSRGWFFFYWRSHPCDSLTWEMKCCEKQVWCTVLIKT